MLELLKNSMRATVETHGFEKCPPIRIIIADGEDNEDVSLKISSLNIYIHLLLFTYSAGRNQNL